VSTSPRDWQIYIEQAVPPPTPRTGKWTLFVDPAGVLMLRADDGTVSPVGGGGGGMVPHHTTHEPGGSDPLAVNAPAGTGSLRSLGTGATQAAAGDHAHAGMVTNPMTAVADLIVGGASGTPTRLGVGANTQVLTVVGGVLTWATPASGGMTNPMTTLGDVITGGASGAPGRLGVGTADQVLSVVAGAPAWAAPVAQQNLLTNGGFEVWQRGAGPFTGASGFCADRWQRAQGAGSTLSVSRDSAGVDAGSQYCLAATYTHAAQSFVYQNLPELVPQVIGRTVTLTVRVRVGTASAVRLAIETRGTGAGFTYSGYHSGGGAYETLTVTRAVPAGATFLFVYAYLDASCTAYLDSAVLAVGGVAPPYVPLHATDDLARCQRYYWEAGGLSTNEFVCVMQAISTTAAIGVILFPVEMAVTPIVTVSAPGDWALLSAAAAALTTTALGGTSHLTRRSARLDASVAAGLIAGNAALLWANTTAAARIRFEANP
jgi:hypothetical protein